MELKQRIELQVVDNESVFIFNVPSGSSYTKCIEVCFSMLEKLHTMQAQAIEAMRPKEVKDVSNIE